MQTFTQKYALIHSLQPLDDGYEYSMENWPLHVTLADVFAIEGDPADLLTDLKRDFDSSDVVSAVVTGDQWFGDDGEVHVKILDKTSGLDRMHDKVLKCLGNYDVVFNQPAYTREGFVAHSTVQKDASLQDGDLVVFDSLTLIDLFPNEDAYRRRVVGTVYFG